MFKVRSWIARLEQKSNILCLRPEAFVSDLEFLLELTDPVSVRKFEKRLKRYHLACRILGISPKQFSKPSLPDSYVDSQPNEFSTEDLEELRKVRSDISEVPDIFAGPVTPPRSHTLLRRVFEDPLTHEVNSICDSYSIMTRVAILAYNMLRQAPREGLEADIVAGSRLIFKGSSTFGNLLLVHARKKSSRDPELKKQLKSILREVRSLFIDGTDTDATMYLPQLPGEDLVSVLYCKSRLHEEFMANIRVVISKFKVDSMISRNFISKHIELTCSKSPMKFDVKVSKARSSRMIPYVDGLQKKIPLGGKIPIYTTENLVDYVVDGRRVNILIGRVKKAFMATSEDFRIKTRAELMDVTTYLDISSKQCILEDCQFLDKMLRT
jgi:hypothetical protein